MKTCNLHLIQQIVHEWCRNAPAEDALEALETLEELWQRDEIWRTSDLILQRVIDSTDPDLDAPI